ncbi:MAG: cadmium-translocating P-type ATPase [Lachnospiraceae bacterium]|nr:cadmium-translocating P-type ATPase [Lachnospiraceae bacterium]
MTKKQKKVLIRIIAATILLVLFKVIDVEDRFENIIPNIPGRYIGLVFYIVPYYVIGYDILRKAVKGIINRQIFDENFLMAIATVGAMVLGDYAEGVAVMLFYQVGELFQSYAVGKSRRSIGELMDIRPDYANIEQDGEIVRVDPDEIETGSIIIVRPGEKIPIDGVVVQGSTTINTSALTGESLPADVGCGDEVLSGCINLSGLVKIRTTKEFAESTVSKILELVENAGSRKSKSENFISKFARYYTPIVCSLALLLAVIPPLAGYIVSSVEPQWGVWVYRALTFLVISCPCALVISIPLSFFAGIGGASSKGILIKGANYLETLSEAKYIVFDKTGTMTKGVFEVVGIHHNAMEEKELLDIVAHAESASSHPISKSIIRAYDGVIDNGRIEDVKEYSGEGVIAIVDGKSVAAGNGRLMDRIGVAYKDCSQSGTIVHIAIDEEYAGHILISDIINPTACEALKKLNQSGIRETVMLTGDSVKVANEVAGKLGIEKVHAELMPGDKVDKVEEIIARKGKKEALIFVGDGINDAPVLSRADIGIAMGALGSDAAIEAADVVLMDDNLEKIALAVRLAKKCMRIVYENIYFAIGIKIICLFLGAIGIANMWLAIFADVGVMVIAVLNAIRALRCTD